MVNYPNPFNPETWIPFELKESSAVTVSIYDVTGLSCGSSTWATASRATHVAWRSGVLGRSERARGAGRQRGLLLRAPRGFLPGDSPDDDPQVDGDSHRAREDGSEIRPYDLHAGRLSDTSAKLTGPRDAMPANWCHGTSGTVRFCDALRTALSMIC
ncbi:hypothetical protein FJZ36_17575 [Candidatus Poribacteria bacterium]|nr:hypothetical protein [Candidatus Poribacteria bacterium]